MLRKFRVTGSVHWMRQASIPGSYPQRRTIGIDVGGGVASAQFAARRHDPDILDGAAFQRPAEMPFAFALALRAVVTQLHDVEIPGADKASVKIHLAGAVGRRAVSAERVEEPGGAHAASRPKVFRIASTA
jgi:hypothetical protein